MARPTELYPLSGICRILSWEHARILQSIDRLARTGEDEAGAELRRELFGPLCNETVLHGRAEETVLYPEVRRLAELGEFARQSRREHDELEAMSRELAEIDPSSWRWGMKFRHFATELEHHFQDEEQELLPRLMRRLPRARLMELERLYWICKRRLRGELGDLEDTERGEAA